MLDNIINLVKDQALGAIANNPEVPSELQGAAADVTASALVDGLKDNISLDNISSIIGLLGGGASQAGSNPLVNGLQSSVVSALSEKVGIDPKVATGIAATAIPAIMSMFAQKNDDPNDSFNFESLVGTLAGKDSGGLLGTLGKLFS